MDGGSRNLEGKIFEMFQSKTDPKRITTHNSANGAGFNGLLGPGVVVKPRKSDLGSS